MHQFKKRFSCGYVTEKRQLEKTARGGARWEEGK